MTLALSIPLIAGLISVSLAQGATLWIKRRTSPEAQAQIVTASTLLLAQLQHRVAALETRLEHLEAEIEVHEINLRTYEDLYGPLPYPTTKEP